MRVARLLRGAGGGGDVSSGALLARVVIMGGPVVGSMRVSVTVFHELQRVFVFMESTSRTRCVH